jgi:signal recognition particle subunit SRP54
MMPGMGGIGADQMQAAERRLKKNEAMICSMTKQEKRNPALLITDTTARSRLRRIAKGSGNKFEEAARFISEFQRMRTMMSRMSKNMPAGQDPSMAGVDDIETMMPGNRSARRAGKKKKKAARGFGGGFG